MARKDKTAITQAVGNDRKAALNLLLEVSAAVEETQRLEEKNLALKITRYLLPLAMTVVTFYVVLATWSFPLLLGLWAAMYVLPEKMELSKSLTKGMNYLITLMFVPVFANLIIEIAVGVVDATYQWTLENELVTAYATGLTLGMVGGDSITGVVIGSLGGTVGMLSSTYSSLNVFVAVAWIVAFMFVIATPLLVSKAVFGSATFAESLVQKMQLGALLTVAAGMRSAVSFGARGAGAAKFGKNMLKNSGITPGGAMSKGKTTLSSIGKALIKKPRL